MSIVVETGAGLPDAEAYASIVDGSTFNDKFGCNDAWANALDSDKEEALRNGARYIDTKYYTQWLGYRYSGTQALEWPRLGVMKGGYLLSASSIPQGVKEANIAAAIQWLEDETSLFPVFDDTSTIKSEDVTVGPVSQKIVYNSGKTGVKKNTLISSLLTGLILPANTMERG